MFACADKCPYRVLSRRQFDQAIATDDFPFGAIDAFPESIGIRVNQNRSDLASRSLKTSGDERGAFRYI